MTVVPAMTVARATIVVPAMTVARATTVVTVKIVVPATDGTGHDNERQGAPRSPFFVLFAA